LLFDGFFRSHNSQFPCWDQEIDAVAQDSVEAYPDSQFPCWDQGVGPGGYYVDVDGVLSIPLLGSALRWCAVDKYTVVLVSQFPCWDQAESMFLKDADVGNSQFPCWDQKTRRKVGKFFNSAVVKLSIPLLGSGFP